MKRISGMIVLSGILGMGVTACGGDEDEMATSMAYTTMGAGGLGSDSDDDDDDEEDDADDDDDDDGDDDDDAQPGDTGGDDDDDDDDPGPMTGGPSDGGEMTTGPMGDGGMPPGDGGGGDPGLMECLDQAVNECENCACNNCLMQLESCEQDPGCIAIRMCAQQNMCTGLGCLGPCGDVIDANGGPLGPSAGLASTLSDCYEASCPGC